MAEGEQGPVSTQEAFEYTFRTFTETLRVLTLEPAEQVRSNGNYNTAFELIFDARSGRYLESNPASYLSVRQVQLIASFIDCLERMPLKGHSGRQQDEVVRFDANLADMRHPDWRPIRAMAAKLMQELAGAVALNQAYFRLL